MKFTARGRQYEWLPIVGFEGLFEVSEDGAVRSLDHYNYSRYVGKFRLYKGKDLTPCPDAKGYLRVCLRKDGEGYNKKVHRLVAEAFIPNPKNLPQINHKDGNKKNNSVSNLEWCDNDYNMLHKKLNGLCKSPKGQDCKRAILTDDQVREIKDRYRYGIGRALAKEYGVHFSTISKIIRNKHWRHL